MESPVDNSSLKPDLNLRVFKRSSKKLVILWDKIDNTDPRNVEIRVQPIGSNTPPIALVDYIINPPGEGPGEQNTVVCVIDEGRNGLDDKLDYFFVVRYPTVDVSSKKLRVIRAGVYPNHDKEDKTKNFHSFLWDEKTKQWRKQCGVTVNGNFYAGVSVIPCPNCGYDGSELKDHQ